MEGGGVNKSIENHPAKSEVVVHKLIAYVSLWVILNLILIGIAVMCFSFMLEKNNFYGKGSTGLIFGVLFGMYKVHNRYFEYVVILKNNLNEKARHG